MSEPTLVTFKKQREKIVNLVSGAEQKFFGKEQKFFSFNTWKFFLFLFGALVQVLVKLHFSAR